MPAGLANGQQAIPGIHENDDIWSLVDLNDGVTGTDFWMPEEMWCPSGPTVSSGTSASSASTPSDETNHGTGAGSGPERDFAAADECKTAKQKKAKRQEQNRVAQQAFRARKERLVRGLSAELASLQCLFASTKAENEQLHSDLRLAQTELAAIRSVLQHIQMPPVGSVEGTPSASSAEIQPCYVSADPSSCTLSLKINVDGLMAARMRQDFLATPPSSETGEGCVDVDLGALASICNTPDLR